MPAVANSGSGLRSSSSRHAVGVVRVLVRHEDRVQVVDREFGVRQPRRKLFGIDAVADQHARRGQAVARLDHQRVALAA